ncbi:Transcription factor bHLH87 Basic helix-loop-helix protein [Vigna angularis]|uniref:Transcription factor bHLH87 Basic helix-loop-helix protein n=1 Tax=Phaseolus angularis TaxID=3914 RepID=A0A8T0JH66_PHAAN|nr:Transcription factor bHLH87 Basic helix-loop-helix protein [Vigna angularis]
MVDSGDLKVDGGGFKPQPKRQRLESPVIPQSNLARQRRQKLSEKTRCLQKLMPWDKKMDQGTLLEEAYKYVRFLQAQFRVLQSMPSHSSSSSPSFRQNSAVFVDLEKLNRSQLLQPLRKGQVHCREHGKSIEERNNGKRRKRKQKTHTQSLLKQMNEYWEKNLY